MDVLQRVVDLTSHSLRQPVLVDDPALRPLAYSAHRPDQADDVRAASILGRGADPEVAEWLKAAGIADAERPLRVAGGEPVGLTPRWCAPIRHQGQLLGYLWVIVDQEPAPAELEVLERCAQDAARAIEQDRTTPPRAEFSSHEALRKLLSAPAAQAVAAGAQLVGAGVARMDRHVVTLVARSGGEPLDDPSRILAGLAVQRFAAATPRPVLHAVWDDHAVAMVAGDDGPALAREARGIGAVLRDHLAHAWGGRRDVTVGIGETGRALPDARASYEQACWTAHVAARMGGHGPVARWADLGVFQLLSAVDAHRAVPAGLEALFGNPNGAMLLETLEVYLDTGGDAQATSARLCLARGSLYYRLRRIEELADVDLRDGGERLTLHLGLKLARLAGRWSGAGPAPLRLAG